MHDHLWNPSDYSRPFVSAYKAVTHKNKDILKGVGYGAGYGGAAGLGIGAKDALGGGGFSSGSSNGYTPAYLNGDKPAAPAASPAGSIFSVPATMAGGAAIAGTAAAGAAGGSREALKGFQDKIKELDAQISALQKNMKGGDSPSTRLQAYDARRTIAGLTSERDKAVQEMNKAVGYMQKDLLNSQAQAARDYGLASRRMAGAESSLNRNIGWLEEGEKMDSWGDPLRWAASKLFSSRDRAEQQQREIQDMEAIRSKAESALRRTF